MSGLPHFGVLVGEEYQRGTYRGDGVRVESTERDRVRVLRWVMQAHDELPDELDDERRGRFLLRFARHLMRGGHESWKLQLLTDLADLPDYEEGYGGSGETVRGAPVEDDGSPMFHAVPASLEAARSDAERWRYFLAAAVRSNSSSAEDAVLDRAQFLLSQFGVTTAWDDTGAPDRAAEFRLLGDGETICRLATGVRKITLPEDQRYIALFQGLARDGRVAMQRLAQQSLGSIFEMRHQFSRAAEAYAQAGMDDHVRQILGNWGRIETVFTQPAGTGAELLYRFRNGRRVHWSAHRIHVDRVLDDLRDELRSKPRQLDHTDLRIEQIGHRIVHERETRYLGSRVADWEQELRPEADHATAELRVTTPLSDAGAYLVKARMEDGNTSRIVVWISDTVIAQKALDRGTVYFVADARTGRPQAGARLRLLGYQWKRERGQRPELLLREFERTTSEDGLVVLGADEVQKGYQWLATATTDAGRLAYLGFQGFWNATYDAAVSQNTKAYLITDRPAYRPGDTVRFKAWIRNSLYTSDEGQGVETSCELLLTDARGEKVLEENRRSDAEGAFDGSYVLPDDATLGAWYLRVKGPAHAGLSFRVEEYEKPEYEVTIEVPEKPVMLGEQVTAKIRARYYFGTPVTEARVRYTVRRTFADSRWHPPGPWDWLYGPGYGWLAPDAEWYPGFRRWGCFGPTPWWWPSRGGPPEVVAQNEVDIGSDGAVEVPIETALARQVFGERDQRYTIEAEVVDPSRRTIVGHGSLLVAERPYRVFVWLDRGFYDAGDTMRVSIAARTLDGRGVSGTGLLQLRKISYDDQGKPTETEVQRLPFELQEGSYQIPLQAASGGQYRVAVEFEDGEGRAEEGGALVTIRGAAGPEDFRFGALELVRQEREYHPGDEAELLVRTDRAGSAVLVFLRPVSGVYLLPRVLRMEGKTATLRVPVSKNDLPNFFVEVVAVADGELHTAVQQIPVPPESKLLDVALTPERLEYEPSESCAVAVAVRDAAGLPFPASLCVTVYDKAIEYVSGGSNLADLQRTFWGWKRHHDPRTFHNLERSYNQLLEPDEVGMVDLGSLYDQHWGLRRRSSGEGGALKKLGRAAEGGVAETRAAFAPEASLRADGFASLEEAEAGDDYGSSAEPPADLTVRSAFADSAFWVATLPADVAGGAAFDFALPENLGTWKIRCFAVGEGTRVGTATEEIVVTKKLFARLQAPRFFVEKDEVVLSANVHNEFDEDREVKVRLEVGPALEATADLDRTVQVTAHGQTRVDWRVRVVDEGEPFVRMIVWSGEDSDAVEMTFPAYIHGAPRMESISGALRPEEDVGEFTFDVPAERRPETARLVVRYSPTVAGALVDALPYLVSYPYGCTEQTLHRFLPTLIVQRMLQREGFDLAAIRAKRTNLNPAELGDPAVRAAGWQQYDQEPVFDPVEVDRMVRAGVDDLIAMQVSDGGWGWFSGFGEHSDPHLTALIVHGLSLARDNDVAVPDAVLSRGIDWLVASQREELAKLDRAAEETRPYKQHASALDAYVYAVLAEQDRPSDAMRTYLLRDRTRLPVHALALLALSFHEEGRTEDRQTLQRMIEQYLVHDEENQSSYLDLPNQNYWWYWYGNDTESHAWYLKLLARVEPESEKAARVAKFLLTLRKNTASWESTRAAGASIEAHAEFARASRELAPDLEVEILVDGESRRKVSIDADNLFSFEATLTLAGDELSTGAHRVEIRRSGTGPLYYNAYLEYFSLQDSIPPAGLEVQVERRFYRVARGLDEADVQDRLGQAVAQTVEIEEPELLHDLSKLQSGDVVEVELIVESKNDYEYLAIEDYKAAGLEAYEARSGYTRRGARAYVEYRDERVALFVRSLPRGVHSFRYRLRAEVPGEFAALPGQVSAMYAPEIRANSASLRLIVEERD
jgi:hypothetical protein